MPIFSIFPSTSKIATLAQNFNCNKAYVGIRGNHLVTTHSFYLSFSLSLSLSLSLTLSSLNLIKNTVSKPLHSLSLGARGFGVVVVKSAVCIFGAALESERACDGFSLSPLRIWQRQ